MAQNIVKELNELTKGLIYISESEYPFTISYWHDAHTIEQVQNKIASQHNHEPELYNMDTFFHKLVHEQDPNDSFVHEQAQRFQTLYTFLKDTLHSLFMYQAGRVERAIYLGGFTPTNECIVLQTTAIET